MAHGKVQPWSFEEVSVALDEEKTPGDAAKELPNRTTLAVQFLRNNAKQYQRGRKQYVTKTLQRHFDQYFQNMGEGKLEKLEQPMEQKVETKEETIVASEQTTVQQQEATIEPEDTCQDEFIAMSTRAEKLLEEIQDTMFQMGALKAKHDTHDKEAHVKTLSKRVDELSEANKKLTEKNEELNEFRNTALEANRSKKPSIGERLAQNFSFGENNRG